MKIGVPKEIKNHEYRVGLTPESVAEILKNVNSIDLDTHFTKIDLNKKNTF